MNTKEIKDYKKHLKLSKRQREILTGLLLGDGHLETIDKDRTYRLKVEHGAKQEEYLMWLYEEFKEWTRSKPYRKIKKNGQKSVGFNTYSHGAFRFYAHQFYENHKKVIPRLINKLLTPLTISVWFMDDGSLKSNKHKTFIIHTVGYNRDELERLQKALERLFNIKTSLHRQKLKYWRLYIYSESAERFKTLVLPHTVRSMKYKLGN